MLVQSIQRTLLQTEGTRLSRLTLLHPFDIALVIEQGQGFRVVVVNDELDRLQRGDMLGQSAGKLLNSRRRRKVEVADDVPVGNAWSTGTESCHEGVGGNATF